MTAVQRRSGDGSFGSLGDLPLVDLVDRLLDRGVVVAGDVVLSVAGVDLVQLGLRAMLQGIEDQLEDGCAPTTRAEVPAHPPSALPHLPSRDAPSTADGSGVATRPVPFRSRREKEHLAFDDDAERGLVQLVLTLVELVREVLQRQALRRVDAGSLDDADVERLGRAFLELDARMEDLKGFFGLSDDDVELRLGTVRDVG